MEELKIYLSAFVFAILATVKMAFPGATEELREDALNLLSNDKNCIEVIETMGRKISQEDITQELIEVFGLGQKKEKEAMKVEDKPETEKEKTEDKQINVINLNPEN